MIFPNGFDDELSRSPFQEFLACQRPEVFNTFDKFIEEENFNTIVELGTCYGGLSKALFDISKKHNCKFITFDILENQTSNQLRKYDVDFRIHNIFNSDYSIIDPIFIEEIKDDQLLILCDGGYKIGEFNCFSKLLKPGDVIMAHDFSYSEEFFKNHSFWGWNEIMEKDILKSINEFNLYYYKMHLWSKMAWCCFKKLF